MYVVPPGARLAVGLQEDLVLPHQAVDLLAALGDGRIPETALLCQAGQTLVLFAGDVCLSGGRAQHINLQCPAATTPCSVNLRELWAG